MEGRNPEFLPSIPEKTDDGFSETKSARVVEGKGMDAKQVKKRKPVIPGSSRLTRQVVRTPRTVRPTVGNQVAPLSRKEKIITVYKENSLAIVGLVEQLNVLDGVNIRQEEQIIAEIKDRRHLQEELLNGLILEQRHQLTEEAISKEAWDLIR